MHNRFIAERFTKFMVELHDWASNHKCEIEVGTYRESVYVTMRKNGNAVKHSFSRSELSVCDEMVVYSALEKAYKNLEKVRRFKDAE